MTKPKVVITDFDYGDLDVERPILEAAGARVVGLQAKSETDLFEEVRDCDAVMNQYARVGAESIARMERCRVIARYGIGVDIVDVDAATQKGILVTNVRDYCTDEVADHAIGLWLALARKLLQYNAATHRGVWRWQTGRPIHRLQGRTMGIVSFGRIGQAIACRAKAFGVELIAYDPASVGGGVVLKEFAREGEPEPDRMVGDFVGAIVADVGNEDAFSGRRVDVDDVDADAVARDHPAAFHARDALCAYPRVLVHDCVAVARTSSKRSVSDFACNPTTRAPAASRIGR